MALSLAALKLMARNSYQVLGRDLKSPSEFLICWTPDGYLTAVERTDGTGGTDQAIAIADFYRIPVLNKGQADHFFAFLVDRLPGKQTQEGIFTFFPS